MAINKRATGVITLLAGLINPFITSKGPSCIYIETWWNWYLYTVNPPSPHTIHTPHYLHPVLVVVLVLLDAHVCFCSPRCCVVTRCHLYLNHWCPRSQHWQPKELPWIRNRPRFPQLLIRTWSWIPGGVCKGEHFNTETWELWGAFQYSNAWIFYGSLVVDSACILVTISIVDSFTLEGKEKDQWECVQM